MKHENNNDDFYLAIPLQKGQISVRELMNGERLIQPVLKNQALMIDMIDFPYGHVESLKQEIYNRGL